VNTEEDALNSGLRLSATLLPKALAYQTEDLGQLVQGKESLHPSKFILLERLTAALIQIELCERQMLGLFSKIFPFDIVTLCSIPPIFAYPGHLRNFLPDINVQIYN